MHPRASRALGFTLVELMITITVLAILILAAAPSMRLWIFNTRVRTSAEALQNGLRLAQSEAVRQSRQVVFGLTNAAPAQGVTTLAGGRNWVAQIVPNATEATRDLFLRGGPMADTTGGVTIAGPRVICFSSFGNVVRNDAPADTGAACAAGAATYDFAHPSGDRALQVQVSISGRVRMCDPSRALAAATPDGCNP